MNALAEGSYPGGLGLALQTMSPKGREQFTVCAHRCDLELSRKLFDAMIENNHIDPMRPEGCKKCWAIRDITLRLSGTGEESDLFFQNKIAPHTPWVRAMQMPSVFNTLLATPEPRPFYEDLHRHAVLRALTEGSADITAEYLAYEAAVASGESTDHFDGAHADSWMTSENGGGWWEYAMLKDESGKWNELLCAKFFPKTCALFRGLPMVDSPRPLSSVRCEGWCPEGAENAFSAGMVSFYRLAPGRSVPMHNGGTNQRLKCHLVVRAPTTSVLFGGGGASITAGGVTKAVSTGDTFCFDDSYLHSVSNEGDIARIVLDVAMWHPGLEWGA
ncbi:hypothetical protein TL16_g07426 [Triparma laevis f. inornata]|uniref:Aspartyl/asparaginy/proline hydroxylase domain-containing protein n=2 Tax=Triparma laevis TaxID=1534972 RepID=A0A9W7FPD5_9STRA|nr:hypothetical protein TL16_g07426 [Triparma laevis f. inornata]GMI16419.1 hypothetical protein TrLO_g12309 [Triparma laevis f. longispina]